jgi:DNA-binding MarR family transcriptional regulator
MARRSEVLRSVLECHLAWRAAMRRVADALSISETAAAMLHEIALAEERGAPAIPSELARILRLTRASVSATLDRLERRGLVLRHCDRRDRRFQRVILVSDSCGALRWYEASMRRVAEGMTAAEATAVVKFLDSISAALEDDAGGRGEERAGG